MEKYVSEFDQWLRNFKKSNPHIEGQQLEGRNLLWEKKPEEIEKAKTVNGNKRKGYEYY